MQHPSLFAFCPHCSAELVQFVEHGVSRRKCLQCHWIQFRNPTVGVAVVLIEEQRLLLGRRCDGGWCIPCGHVEWDEDVENAAIREMAEETGLQVALTGIVAVNSNFHQPERQTVGIWYRGRRVSGRLHPGDDLMETDFFKSADMPPLKFPTDAEVIKTLSQELAHR